MQETWLAGHRFALGMTPEEAQLAAPDPRAWLLGHLRAPDSSIRLQLASQASSGEGLAKLRQIRALTESGRKAERSKLRQAARTMLAERLRVIAATSTPFWERWVAFWSNVFSVSMKGADLLAVAPSFELEVVRPHAAGRLSDLLVASTQHPAMLAYLDNHRSIGPTSRAGLRADRGLNENLAREILELHTLGVNGGYDQADVEGLAKLLTGWTLASSTAMGMTTATGAYAFDPRRHEPGKKVLMGRSFEGGGEADGVAALRYLAEHPSTHRHLATRLGRHFLGSEPSASLIADLAAAFATDDLREVASTLVLHPDAWEPAVGVHTPWEFVLCTARLVAKTDRGDRMFDAMESLGQPVLQAPSPAGWPELSERWLGPGAWLSRVEWASEVAAAVDAPAALERIRAVSPVAVQPGPAEEALAVFLMSPGFQRR